MLAVERLELGEDLARVTKRARYEILELIIEEGAHLGGVISSQRHPAQPTKGGASVAAPPIRANEGVTVAIPTMAIPAMAIPTMAIPAMAIPTMAHLLLHVSLLRLGERVVLHGRALGKLVVHG